MTLSSTNTKVIYNGDGATSEFAIGFVFWNSDDLRVIHRDAGGTETVWTRGTHYTVSGGAGATGTLTVRTAPTDYTPAAGESLTIKDAQPEVQGDSLPLSGAFPSTVVEQRLDRLTRLIQIHSEEIARSVLLPETASLSGLKIPEPGAGELVRYNLAGTSLETVKAGDLSLGVDTLLTGLAANDFLRWDNAQGAWVNIAPGATGLALFQDATPVAARAELGLGTAALANIGVAAGNLPAMDATGYPAADGSRITNVSPGNVTAGIAPRGYIDGLILSNNPIDAAHDIDIAPGVARDGGDAANLALSSVLTKRTDASWAEGNSQGGLDGTESVIGTPGANTWYHVWLIRRSDSGVVDALFSESATIPAMPVNYDQKRRIGAILTDGAGNVVEFYQVREQFFFKDPITDHSGAPGTTPILIVVSSPLGIVASPIMDIRVTGTAGGQYGYIWSPLGNKPTVTNINYPTFAGHSEYSNIPTNTSSQLYLVGNVTGLTPTISTKGWIDPRGRNA